MKVPATIRPAMPESSDMTRHVVGVMTGTSIDGMDAALVRIEGRGLDIRASLIRHLSAPLGDLQPRLRAAADQKPMTAGEFAQLVWDFGVLHANVIERLLQAEKRKPDLICIHGQTVFHQPPISWQLVNPAPIAARFDCPVVSDLRQADLAHGGQGAPITPIADWILFRDSTRTRAIVNLGGFCNVTIVPRQRAGPFSAPSTNDLRDIRGFDVCACNQLLDAVAREVLKQPFDKDGTAAARGHASTQAVESLRAMLDKQRRGRRSLGTGDEAQHWIMAHRANLAPDDLVASAVHAIAQTILDAVREYQADELILAGGGARNLALRDALCKHASNRVPMNISDDLAVPIDAREAICFAILGALCQDGVPITLPAVTGCTRPAPMSGSCCGRRAS